MDIYAMSRMEALMDEFVCLFGDHGDGFSIHLYFCSLFWPLHYSGHWSVQYGNVHNLERQAHGHIHQSYKC